MQEEGVTLESGENAGTDGMQEEGVLAEAQENGGQDEMKESAVRDEPTAFAGLDALHLRILSELMAGNPVEREIADERLMPSVVTDTINEAFYDEIGDNILECDGSRVTFVEDYREEVMEALGGHGK